MPEKFKSLSPAEFFYRNREIAGFSNPARALYQTVRELVENALDATDCYGILPTIQVEISRESNEAPHYRVTVADNGIGIPPEHVPQAFGQVLYGSKYVLKQTRGMFGLGVKMAILYGQITTGKPVIVETVPYRSKYKYSFKILIDIEKNQPIVLERKVRKLKRRRHGTLVSVVVEGDWGRAKSRIIEYIKRTAMVAPYANIYFKDPDGNVHHYPRVIRKLPPPPKETKPHPHGVDIELLKTLISNIEANTLLEFLIKAFQSVGEKAAKEFLEFAKLDPNIKPSELSIDDLKYLAMKLKEFNGFKSPRGTSLSPLGEEIIEAGLKQILKPEFVVAVTRKPSAYSGHPFIVEVGIAYGGQIPPAETPYLYRFANKIPLLYDEKADVAWKVVTEEIDWRNYGVTFPAPLAILTHICSTKVPYKGVGKESVAEVPEVERELKNAIREAARKLKTYISKKMRELEAKKKIVALAKYIPEVSESLAVISRPPTGEHNGLSPEQIAKMLYKILEVKLEKLGLKGKFDLSKIKVKIST
ncbi:MAG TPA: DNA topoisomerase VI subunit B [Desulfurococcales archaeon]|nr:DNA topoisomerase VI subunit B [Desulfurococcales archaeon]